MVELVSKSQAISTNVIAPRGIQSRVFNLELSIPAGVGNGDQKITPPLGSSVRLLGVDLHLMNPTINTVIGGFIYISWGTGDPTVAGSIALSWEPIIYSASGQKPGMAWRGIRDDYHWDMNRLFTTEATRFGAMIENFAALQAWTAWVSFQVSEG